VSGYISLNFNNFRPFVLDEETLSHLILSLFLYTDQRERAHRDIQQDMTAPSSKLVLLSAPLSASARSSKTSTTLEGSFLTKKLFLTLFSHSFSTTDQERAHRDIQQDMTTSSSTATYVICPSPHTHTHTLSLSLCLSLSLSLFAHGEFCCKEAYY
jgi:hypothetical protein